MSARTWLVGLWLCSTTLVVPAGRADNPIIQTKFTADPAPVVFDGVVYLYTTHDEDDAKGFTMYDWMLFTSTDMVNWTDHGVIASVRAPTKTFAWADGFNAWAPQAITRNGKYYLYCPLVRGGHMDIGVAVADHPEGPFRDALGGPLIHTPSTHDIDPSVFIDHDGQAYLYWGHQQLSYVKLNQDMTSYSGGVVSLPRPNLYEEGPWFYRRGDHFYLAFASYCCPEGIGYAMSDKPTGPWTTKGYIMRPNSVSSGNHPGIIDFQGVTYVFGFDYSLNFAETSVHRERRSINLARMTYNDDGTIAEVPWWSKEGVPQVGTLNPYVRTEAETIAWSKGLKTERCDSGGMDVTSIEDGDFLKVKGVDFGAGATSFDARVASAGAGGTIELHLDDRAGPLVGRCTVTGTGGAQRWETASCAVSGASGVHDLFMVFTGGAGNLFSFDWWRFRSAVPSTDAGVPLDGGVAPDGGSSPDGDSGSGSGGGHGTAGGGGGAGGSGGASGKGGGRGDTGGTGGGGTGGAGTGRRDAGGAESSTVLGRGCSSAGLDSPWLLSALAVFWGLQAMLRENRRARARGRPLLVGHRDPPECTQ